MNVGKSSGVRVLEKGVNNPTPGTFTAFFSSFENPKNESSS